jgi:ATP sulfurylase
MDFVHAFKLFNYPITYSNWYTTWNIDHFNTKSLTSNVFLQDEELEINFKCANEMQETRAGALNLSGVTVRSMIRAQMFKPSVYFIVQEVAENGRMIE